MLEIGVGSGVLAIGTLRAGAKMVTALEISPRAKNFAGFNIVLNGFTDRVEILDGSEDIFAPVRGRRFDYIISNPPFLPTLPGTDFFLHSAAGPYGLDVLERIVKDLDDYLSDEGHVQIVTVAPGNDREPFLLFDLVKKHLRGATRVRANSATGKFAEMVNWLKDMEMATTQQARDMVRVAKEDGVTDLYLCMIHYQQAANSFVVEPSKTVYHDWDVPLTNIEQF